MAGQDGNPAVLTSLTTQTENAYRDRVTNLTKHLTSMHEGQDKDRNSRYDHLQGKMKHLDERLAASQDASGKKFGVLKDTMMIFQDALKSERENREHFAEAKENEIGKVDAALQAPCSLSRTLEEKRRPRSCTYSKIKPHI